MLLHAKREQEEVEDGFAMDEEEQERALKEDPTLRFDRFGTMPDKVAPLAAMDRDFDLKALRKAIR